MNLKKKLERYLRVNLLGPSPRLIKKEFTGRGLTKVEKHWSISCAASNASDRILEETVANSNSRFFPCFIKEVSVKTHKAHS